MNEASKPYVGLIVDFYPDNSTRIPAVVLEVYPDSSSEGQSLRPKLDLKCFKVPEDEVWTEVEPVEFQADEENPELAGRWGYAHEFNLQQEDEEFEYAGTKTNEHVGNISQIIEE